MRSKLILLVIVVIIAALSGCKGKPPQINLFSKPATTYKGLYSFGPEVKSFKECASGHEFWVADSSAELELKYSQLHFDQPDQAVYIEVQGEKIKSQKDGLGSDYDSILVVRKLVKLNKDLPKNGCN